MTVASSGSGAVSRAASSPRPLAMRASALGLAAARWQEEL